MLVELAAARRVELRVLRGGAARFRRRLAQFRLARRGRLQAGRLLLATGQAGGQALQQAHRAVALMVMLGRRRVAAGLDLGRTTGGKSSTLGMRGAACMRLALRRLALHLRSGCGGLLRPWLLRLLRLRLLEQLAGRRKVVGRLQAHARRYAAALSSA